MRKCPVCSDEVLVRVEYEGVMVMKCFGCYGHLVDMSSLQMIKRTESTSPDELVELVDREFHQNSEQEIRCPKCRITMKKSTEAFADNEIEYDVCKSCSLIWFDGGELAALQLGYESSEKATEARRMRLVSEEFESDPDRVEVFEYNKSLCRKESDLISDAFAEGMTETLSGQGVSGQGGILSLIAKLLFNLR